MGNKIYSMNDLTDSYGFSRRWAFSGFACSTGYPVGGRIWVKMPVVVLSRHHLPLVIYFCLSYHAGLHGILIFLHFFFVLCFFLGGHLLLNVVCLR